MQRYAMERYADGTYALRQGTAELGRARHGTASHGAWHAWSVCRRHLGGQGAGCGTAGHHASFFGFVWHGIVGRRR